MDNFACLFHSSAKMSFLCGKWLQAVLEVLDSIAPKDRHKAANSLLVSAHEEDKVKETSSNYPLTVNIVN